MKVGESNQHLSAQIPASFAPSEVEDVSPSAAIGLEAYHPTAVVGSGCRGELHAASAVTLPARPYRGLGRSPTRMATPASLHRALGRPHSRLARPAGHESHCAAESAGRLPAAQRLRLDVAGTTSVHRVMTQPRPLDPSAATAATCAKRRRGKGNSKTTSSSAFGTPEMIDENRSRPRRQLRPNPPNHVFGSMTTRSRGRAR